MFSGTIREGTRLNIYVDDIEGHFPAVMGRLVAESRTSRLFRVFLIGYQHIDLYFSFSQRYHRSSDYLHTIHYPNLQESWEDVTL
jgi:hypothetical protein